jgi:phosphoglycerate kinase
MDKMTVKDVKVSGKRTLVRVDFNVPLDKKTGEITDDARIRAALPSITYLIDKGAKVILMSHLGRPDGKVVESLRLGIIARHLSQLLGKPVAYAKDCIGPEVEKMVSALKNGDVLLLENLRFHPEEESGDSAFARALARLGDIYVNDAFGTAHRAHASVTGVAKHLPAVAGFLMEKEIKSLGNLLQNPERPFAALLGGAKISDKVVMLENIMDKVDTMLIGGGMAGTFLKAQGYEIGISLLEADRIETAKKLMNKAREKKVRLLLPLDAVVAAKIEANAPTEVVPISAVPKDKAIADIGPQTVKAFSDELRRSKTIFWNGPLGVYEIPQFAKGTQEIARLLAGLRANTVIGGGNTADIVNEMGLTHKMTFVSTGGGASLEFLSKGTLPGIEVLPDKN